MIVSGSILDNDFGIIPFANVVIVGENRSTIADADGKFSIAVNDSNSIVQFSHAGYDYDQITAADFNKLGYILLFPNSLDEVVLQNNYKSDNTLLYVVLGFIGAFAVKKVFFSNNPKAVNVKA